MNEPGSVFTRMIRGEVPARFIWSDELVVALLSSTPLAPGHTLVVPRQEVDDWVDLEADLLDHLMGVAQAVAAAIRTAFRPVRVGMVIAGVQVRHVHIHLAPIDAVQDLNFATQDPNPDPADLDLAADRIRSSLHELGHGRRVPDAAK